MERKGIMMIGTHKTQISITPSISQVTYHETPIVIWTPERIVLHSGGWRTATTKRRMNQTSKEFDLDFHVGQRYTEWYVLYKHTLYPFEDAMELIR